MSDHPVDALIRRLQTEASQYKLQWEALRDTFTEAEKFREKLQSQIAALKSANEKLEYDKHRLVAEAKRRDEKWMAGINEVLGEKLDYDDPCARWI